MGLMVQLPNLGRYLTAEGCDDVQPPGESLLGRPRGKTGKNLVTWKKKDWQEHCCSGVAGERISI